MKCKKCGELYLEIGVFFCSKDCQVLWYEWEHVLNNLELGPAGKPNKKK